jgi:hypothetical protein
MKTIKSNKVALQCYGIYNKVKDATYCIFETEKEAQQLIDRFGLSSETYEIVIVKPN